MASTAGTPQTEPEVAPLGLIYPETGQKRPCFNCRKMVGGGKGSWKRCSACQSASYCGVECQKAHWQVHKPQCKATVAARARVEELRRTDPNAPEVLASAPEIALLDSLYDVYGSITGTAYGIAARSALRIDREDSLVFSHYLEIKLEWRKPEVVKYKDPAAVVGCFRLASIKVVKKDVNGSSLKSFNSAHADHVNRHGFVVFSGAQDAKGNQLGFTGVSHMPFPVHSYYFRKFKNRSIKIDPDWEKTLRKTLDREAAFWAPGGEDVFVKLFTEDIARSEGSQTLRDFMTWSRSNMSVLAESRWPPRIP